MSAKRSPFALRSPRNSARAGFTMIELTVALVAGLIVAMAIAGLSREATRTFNEEIRSSAAEASLRTAVDRLRADLQRASFMSTPNIQNDPMIATAPGQPNIPITAVASLQRLAGIRLYPGSSTQSAANGIGLATINGVNAAMIDITGNMTSAEQFEIQAVINGAGGGACTQILLSTTSPAIYRMLNANSTGVPDPSADVEMLNTFQPVAGHQFGVRILDNTGHSQFLLTCATPPSGASGTGQVAGMGASYSSTIPGSAAPYVYVQGSPLTAQQTGGISGVQGNGIGCFVNPVHVVRWEILGPGSSPDVQPAQDIAALNGSPLSTSTVDPNKYDLVRSYVVMETTNSGKIIGASSEVVAEYAVDLDFALTVDTTLDTTGQTPNLVTYDFGDTNNGTVGGVIAANNPAGPTTPDPQRIRSVRVRLVTRTAQADRSLNISDAGAPFMYRYCLNASGCPLTYAAAAAAPYQYARARTVVTEQSLPNQAQAFF